MRCLLSATLTSLLLIGFFEARMRCLSIFWLRHQTDTGSLRNLRIKTWIRHKTVGERTSVSPKSCFEQGGHLFRLRLAAHFFVGFLVVVVRTRGFGLSFSIAVFRRWLFCSLLFLVALSCENELVSLSSSCFGCHPSWLLYSSSSDKNR